MIFRNGATGDKNHHLRKLVILFEKKFRLVKNKYWTPEKPVIFKAQLLINSPQNTKNDLISGEDRRRRRRPSQDLQDGFMHLQLARYYNTACMSKINATARETRSFENLKSHGIINAYIRGKAADGVKNTCVHEFCTPSLTHVHTHGVFNSSLIQSRNHPSFLLPVR